MGDHSAVIVDENPTLAEMKQQHERFYRGDNYDKNKHFLVICAACKFNWYMCGKIESLIPICNHPACACEFDKEGYKKPGKFCKYIYHDKELLNESAESNIYSLEYLKSKEYKMIVIGEILKLFVKLNKFFDYFEKYYNTYSWYQRKDYEIFKGLEELFKEINIVNIETKIAELTPVFLDYYEIMDSNNKAKKPVDKKTKKLCNNIVVFLDIIKHNIIINCNIN
jgi:hypothetical protein